MLTLPATGAAFLPHFGLLRFSGADAQTFLQGQLSCDVAALENNRATYGSYNNPKGRMLASFLLWRDDAGYTMKLPRSVYEPTRKRLAMYVMRSKVSIADVSAEHTLIGILGADAIANLPPSVAEIAAARLTMSETANVRNMRLDEERCLIVVRRDDEAAIRADLSGLTPVSADAWDWSNIRAGIPYITPATQEQFVPQMANLDLINGVSFSKGCYPGQEIVARMHYLGKLKQRMYVATLNTDEIAQPGDKLFSADTGEQATGMIVNAAHVPDMGRAVLGVMQIESFKGGKVHVKSPAGPTLVFGDLPYQIP